MELLGWWYRRRNQADVDRSRDPVNAALCKLMEQHPDHWSYFNDCLNRYTMIMDSQGLDTTPERIWLMGQVPTLLKDYRIDLRSIFPDVEWDQIIPR